MIYGYARVSTREQKIDRQLKDLEKVKCDKIFIEKQSGKDFESRQVYQSLKKKLRAGDKLVCCSLDRLGRNYEQIVQEWKWLSEKNCYIQILDMPILNTSIKFVDGLDGKFISDLVLQILAYVSQKEREKIKQRQAEGIKIAKEKGVKFGRSKSVLPPNTNEILEQYEKHLIRDKEAIEKLGVSRSSFYRILKEWREKEKL